MAYSPIPSTARVTVLGYYGAADTTIKLIPGDGTKIPATPFEAIWYDSSRYGNYILDPQHESIQVVKETGDGLQIVRALHNTTATPKANPNSTYVLSFAVTVQKFVKTASTPGKTGASGPQGVPGQSIVGATGIRGMTGPKGATGTGGGGGGGLQGATGLRGATGLQGVTGAGGAYTNTGPTPVTIGGIPAGATFINQSMKQMWDALLYPYQYPAFSSFSISGESNPLEVGDTIPAPVTFVWTTTNPTNILPATISIMDWTLSLSLAAGLNNTGSQAVVMPGPIQLVTSGSHQFRIDGYNSKSLIFLLLATYNWWWRFYWGPSANTTLVEADIKALASNVLSNVIAGNYSMGTTGYKYICVPDIGGTQVNSVKDQLTNLNVSMVTVADDPAYSNIDGGGFYYDLVSVTNVFSIAQDYRVYRTRNVLGASIVMVVT